MTSQTNSIKNNHVSIVKIKSITIRLTSSSQALIYPNMALINLREIPTL